MSTSDPHQHRLKTANIPGKVFFVIALGLIFAAPRVSGDTSNAFLSSATKSSAFDPSYTPPASPYLDLVEIIEGGACSPATIDGSTAYAGYDALLVVIDASDPANPTKIANLALEANLTDIIVNGDYAYLLGSDGGDGSHLGTIWVLDIADPASPSVIAANTDGTGGARFTISGDCLFVAQGSAGLRILDISNPVNPVDVGSYPTEDSALDVVVRHERAYIAEIMEGLRIVDVSNPASPTLDTLMAYPWGAISVDASDSVVVFTDLFLSQVRIVDISDPANPFVASTIGGDDIDVAVAGSYAHLVGNDGYFRVLDVSDPASPSVVGTAWLTAGDRLAVSGDLAVVSTGNYSTLQVVDISTPASPQEVGSFDSLHHIQRVAVAGDYLAIAREYYGCLWMMNTANPDDRHFACGTHGFADATVGLEVRDDYVYIGIADSWYVEDSGVAIFDISDPTNPNEAAFVPSTDSWVNALDVEGTRTYYAKFQKLVVLDTSDPESPVELGRLTTGQVINQVAAAGPYAYLAHNESGLTVVDVSNPDSMFVVANRNFGASLWEIVADGDHVYAAGSGAGGGLWVFDVADPTNPIQIAVFNSGGSANGIVIDGPFLHLTGTADNRYRILDITDPTNPVEVVYNDAGGITNRVAIDPPYVWAISSHHGGLLKFLTNVVTGVPDRPTLSFRLAQNYPNPFNPSTTIEFLLPVAGMVELAVFNIRGERVATLIDDSMPAGLNRVTWDGRNDSGAEVSSGVYFYRLRSRGVQDVKKMLFLK